MAQWAPEALSASDIKSVVDALPDFLAETKCPSCNSSDASIYRPVEDMKNVKYCSSCDRLFGIDDSMNLDDLRQLMEEGRVKTDRCACGNDDVNAFIFEECQQSGGLYLKCMNCKLRKDIDIIPTDVDVMPEDTEDRILDDDRLVGDNGPPSACQTLDDQIPRQPYQPFTCECGNEENELFEKVALFDASGNPLLSVRCWNCDRETKLLTNKENYCLIECVKCGNDNEELFDKTYDRSGNIDSIFCHACGTRLQLMESMKTSEQNSFESSERPIFVSYKKTKVTSLEDIKRGDHIAWKRCGGIYSHHAIVAEVLLSTEQLDVIHNTGAEGGKAANGGSKFRIQRDLEAVDLSKGDLYLCNYEPGECLESDEVIARAESLLDEKIYNLFLSNCEHFATLCKTAVCFSDQVTSFVDFIRGLGTFSVKGTQDVVIVVIKSKLKKLTIGSVIERAKGLAGGVRSLSISGTVAISLAVEGIVFGVKTYGAFKEYKNGDINWNQFCAKTADAGCSSGIRFVCTSAGGVIGQLLIPIPFAGSLIGCSIGAILGHLLGKKAGRRCAEAVLGK